MDHLIIDGLNMAFRAHYAYYGPGGVPLHTSKGVLSGCIYGFMEMLQAIKRKLPQCHVIIAWDTQSTRKKAVYAEYKANRPEFTLTDQVKDLKEIFKALNVSQTEYDGEEADDVIASLVRQYKEDGKIFVYSGDKDMLQLVENGRVIVMASKKKETIVYDEAAVKREHGVSPKDLTCFLCLRGDDTDNVPGVARVRSTVLANLIEKYKDLHTIYANLHNEKLTEFELQSLAVFKNQSSINYQLVKLRDDLELNVQTGITNPEVLAVYLDKYEIKKINPDAYPKLFSKTSSSKHETSMLVCGSLFD